MRGQVDFRSLLRWSKEQLFEWHGRPYALKRAIPPTEKVRFLANRPSSNGGRLYTFLVKRFFGWKKWVLHLKYEVKAGKMTLSQHEGPLKKLIHTTELFSPGSGCELVDRIDFILGGIPLFEELRRDKYSARFERYLKYKHALVDHDLDLIHSYPTAPKKILITGSSGLVGSALSDFLTFAGHEVICLVREKEKESENCVFWNSETGEADRERMEGIDVVVNLSGRNVALKRWSSEEKKLLRDSRIVSTERLTHLLGGLSTPPKVFLCASAIGIYGDRGDELLSESADFDSSSFLGRLAADWEEASKWIEGRGVRVAQLRFGMVLSPKGGALAKMLPLFKRGIGSCFGNGEQFVSWIALDDLIGGIYHVIQTDTISGPINFCTSNPLRNLEFSKQLASQFSKSMGPALSPSLVHLLFGQMGSELFLTSIRATPEKLKDSGFRFRYPTFKAALDHLLGYIK